MKRSSEEMKGIALTRAHIDEQGLHLCFEASTITDYETLRRIGEQAQRPVDAFGGPTGSGAAYLWLCVPLTKVERTHSFGNEPRRKKP